MPTKEELSSLDFAATRLWDLDDNRCIPGTDYILNTQQGKRMWDEGDYADEPLFAFVDEALFLEKATFKAFVSLLDNYESKCGQREDVTPEEMAENRKFLELIMDTLVMKYVFEWLKANGKTGSKTQEEFIAELNQL